MSKTKKSFKYLSSVLAIILCLTGTIMSNAQTLKEPTIEDIAPYLNYREDVDWDSINKELEKIDQQHFASLLLKERTTNEPQPMSLLYGIAKPYRYVGSTNVNCYGYALYSDTWMNPGNLAYYYGGVKFGDSLETVKKATLADLQRIHYTDSRVISSASSPIRSDEYRIALRVANQFLSGQQLWDFHYMLQCSDGSWCEKAGQNPSVNRGKINPSKWDWAIRDTNGSVLISNFYNSSTVYIAVKTTW